MTITDPVAFIRALLADPEFRRDLEREDQRKWETFTLRLLAWDGESEELPETHERLMDMYRQHFKREKSSDDSLAYPSNKGRSKEVSLTKLLRMAGKRPFVPLTRV